jgi:hypothetical protein
MSKESPDALDLFCPDYEPSPSPGPWYPGANLDLDDYSRYLLRELPRGRPHAVRAAELARRLNLPWIDNEGPLRGLIRAMVHERQWPIVSYTTRGDVYFYILDSREEMESYANGLRDRMARTERYLKTIEAAWERRHG